MGAATERDLHVLIETAYEAAARPHAWSDFLRLLCEAIDADASALHIYDASSIQGCLGWWYGFPEEAAADYPNWSTKNPHMAAFAGRMATGMVLASSPIRRHDYLRSEYYNEYMRRHLPMYAATGCCVHSSDALSVVISADRLAQRDEFDSSTESLWKALVPHLQRAVTVSRKLAHLDLAQVTATEILDRLDVGMALLSDRGVVLTINDVGRALVAEADAVVMTREGGLRALGPEAARFEAMIKSACGSRTDSLQATGGAMVVSRESGSTPLEVVVSPIRVHHFVFTHERPTAVVFIRDPDHSPPRIARLQQLYGLSAAEARVAQRLLAGLSVDEVAEALQVRVPTIRTHVRRLIEKTGAKSISDLMRRLAGLPPVR